MQAILGNFLLLILSLVFPCSRTGVLQIAHGHRMSCPGDATSMVLNQDCFSPQTASPERTAHGWPAGRMGSPSASARSGQLFLPRARC